MITILALVIVHTLIVDSMAVFGRDDAAEGPYGSQSAEQRSITTSGC